MPTSRRLRISGPAQRDLSQIGTYTKKTWGAAQKKKYLGQIKQTLAVLAEAPGLGTLREDIAEGLRSHVVGRHIVFYREAGAELVIARVLHQRMEPSRRFRGSE